MGLLNRRSASAGQKLEKEITVINRLGLHARPAAMFVRIASRYRSEVWVEKEGEQINGKSIMIARSFGRELLERYGSPLYVYDLDEAERQAKALFDLLPKSAQVLYSVKANPIPEVCAALKAAGCRVEIASPLELKVVFEAGFTPDQILCSGPGKTAGLVREMLLAGVTHFSCDSWYDLERLAGVASATKKSADALLRLQVSGAPTGSVGVGAMQSHFGADPAELLNGAYPLRRLCTATTVNIAEPVDFYELPATPDATWTRLQEQYEQALALFEQAQFRQAMALLIHLAGDFPTDVPTMNLLQRSMALFQNPPPKFDPVWHLKAKTA